MSNTNRDYQRYLTKLFRPGELVCLTRDVFGTQLVDLEHALTLEPVNFVSLNPLHTSRADGNVTSHRNLLIEFDGLSLEEQMAELTKKRVPYTTLVYSGGKSLHAVIALEEEVSREEYAELFKYIRYVLWQCDPSCRNPSRLTRVAGADRAGTIQELVSLKKSVSLKSLYKWLAQFESHIAACEEREQEQLASKLARQQGGDGLEAVDPQTLAFLSGEVGTRSSRHNRLVAAAFELFECGVEYDEALALLEKAADLHGVTADPKRANEGESIVNYVYGQRRRRE